MNIQAKPLLGLAVRSLAILHLLLCAGVSGTEPTQFSGMLWLTNGDYLAGTFAQAEDKSKIAWQHPAFASAFEFDVAMVASASFRRPPDAKPAQGDFGIELSGGDRLFGSVIGIDEQFVELRTARLGDIKVPRQRILRLFRWQNGESVTFADGDDAARWRAEGDKSQWQTRGGQLVSQHPDAWISSDVSIPHQARMDLEVAWDKEPNFEIAFGVNPMSPKTSAATAFRIEVWDGQIVAVWALGDGVDGSADVGVIGKVAQMHGKLRLTIELDQIFHHAMVWSEHGQLLAELQLKPREPRTPQSGFWLQNINGTVALDALQIVPGFAAKAEKEELEKDVFYLQDGRMLKGIWTDVQADAWMLTDQGSEQRIDPDEVAKIRMAGGNVTNGADAANSRSIQLTTFDGTRLNGSLEKLSTDFIEIRSEAIVQKVTIPTGSVRRLSVIGAVALPPATVGQGLARLESEDTRLHGRLVDSDPESASAVLRFEAGGSGGTSMLPTFSGRLVYHEPRPKVIEPVRPQRIQRPPQGPAVVWGAFARAFGNNAKTQSVGRKSLYLRSGEIIGGNVTRIDSEGILFESDMTSLTRLPHDQVRAVQLLPGTGEPEIADLNRERLLTVPRMRKKDPPTHLIVATNGDAMRCRLHKLTDKAAEVETRLETIEIDRNHISQILWLETHKPPAMQEDGAGDDALEGPQVRAVLRDGNRLSMVPESVSNGELRGSSPLLSQCRVSLSDVDQLLFGTATKSADSEPYASWRLSDAPEPIDTSDAGGERLPGLNPPLVGTEAPDFKLDLLDGTRFTLSSQRGKVTVLDFWATWCGPCLHAMPIVDETVKAFPAEDVTLVTINLQEAAEPIRTTLNRLGINPIVALDIDGVAAARYQADAIPQTVVIDRAGKISRLFVGGGDKLGEQLSEAIRDALSDGAAAP